QPHAKPKRRSRRITRHCRRSLLRRHFFSLCFITSAGIGFVRFASTNRKTYFRRRQTMTDKILFNGRITTLDPKQPETQAIAITDGKVEATDTTDKVMRLADSNTETIDLEGRRVIPGLNDSHLHLIRGGLSFNMELRWENVPSV